MMTLICCFHSLKLLVFVVTVSFCDPGSQHLKQVFAPVVIQHHPDIDAQTWVCSTILTL